MAKVSIEIDTEKKEAKVKVGKKQIDNVSAVYVTTEEGGYFSLEIAQHEDLDGLRKTTRLYASDKDSEWIEDDAVDYEDLAKALKITKK